MNVQGNPHYGKLFVGGCGTQLGLLTGCGLITAVLLMCLVCSFTNAVTLGVAQDVSIVPPDVTATATVTPTPTSAVLDSLLGEVQLLHGEVEFLRTNIQGQPVIALPTATPTPTPIPYVTANQSGVNLRSGPGTSYNLLGVLPMDQSLEIVGRNPESTWWLIATGDGLFAWASADLVSASYVSDAIPVVTIPSLMVWGTPGTSQTAENNVPASSITTPMPFMPPPGTPTATAHQERQFVQDMPAYKRLTGHLLIPPVSESVSPHGDQIAITERIKLYTVTTDGALSQIWFEDTDKEGPLGNVAWSPDGDYLAFVVGYKEKYCSPCRNVAVLRMADGQITYLEHPNGLDLDAPRWTQDGRMLVNAHPGEPADGVAYIYSVSGKGQMAQGTYVLSSSHEGQRWFPWQPGKTWIVGSSERADSYNAD